MIQLILFFMMMINQLIFLSNHPLMFTMMIILQTLFMSFLIGELFINMWFSYILFLIYLGGMLVLFIYMTSLTPNLMFFNFKLPLIIILIMILNLLIILPNNFHLINYPNSDSYSIQTTTFLKYKESSMFLYIFFSSAMFKLSWILMIYLLVTLIVATSISNIKKGPLRKSF